MKRNYFLNKMMLALFVFAAGCSNQTIRPEASQIIPVQTSTQPSKATTGKLLISDQSFVYLSDPAGKQKEKILAISEPVESMALSPDGKRLAYFDRQDVPWIENIDTGKKQKLQIPFMSNPLSTLEWSPSETELIFSCASENLPYVSICSLNIADGSLRALLDARALGIHDLNTWVGFKSQSRDGSRVAFVVAPIPEFGSPNKDSIYILYTKTNQTTLVFDSHTSDIHTMIRVAVSPDGQTLLFDARMGERSQIFEINSDGTGLKQITNSDVDVMFPFWSPDGKSFCAVASQPNTTHLQLTFYNLNGETINTINFDNASLWGWFGQ